MPLACFFYHWQKEQKSQSPFFIHASCICAIGVCALKFKFLFLLASSVVMLIGCSNSLLHTPDVSQIPPAINANGVMVGTDNLMTLYTYAGDGINQSACLDECAKTWPPLLASGNDASRGDFSVFIRSDGRMQWALMGKPLYFWAEEASPGDIGGETENAQWRAYRVAGEQ